MLILSLDTTTRGGSVAVVRGGQVLALVPGDESRTHGERLPAEFDAALARAGVGRGEVDLLAVAVGPGGFTGLRIGLAAMQGLAMTLQKPVAGVPTLDALAAQISPGAADLIVPWMDAQRGDVFATIIDAATRDVVEPAVADHPASVIARWRARLEGRRVIFIGDAVDRDAAAMAPGDHGWVTKRPDPLAPQIAALARAMAEEGRAGAPHALTPIYVRRPDAEIERERRMTQAGDADSH